MHAQDEFDIILLPARCILTRSGSTSGGSGSAADLNMLKLAEGNSNQGFSAYTPAAPRDRQWHDCLLCNTQRPIRAGSLRKQYHNVCCTCPSFGASFGPSQYFPQYARRTRSGACVANIVILHQIDFYKSLLLHFLMKNETNNFCTPQNQALGPEKRESTLKTPRCKNKV